MHVEKNVCESILGTLLKIKGKIKDGDGARLDMLADQSIRKNYKRIHFRDDTCLS